MLSCRVLTGSMNVYMHLRGILRLNLTWLGKFQILLLWAWPVWRTGYFSALVVIVSGAISFLFRGHCRRPHQPWLE